MGVILKKIKKFFKTFFSRNKVKQLDTPKATNLVDVDTKTNGKTIEDTNKKQDDKKEFFEIYNKVKKGEYNLKDLTEEQSKKIITILNSEINLKKDKLDHDIMELNIVKTDNRINEKNRIFELYNNVKNESIDLNDIDREDLLKIRKLLLEEAKIQDERLENEIKILEMSKKVS